MEKKKEIKLSGGTLEEPDRKMAFVAAIVQVEPITDAEKIELATVLGWKVVVKKGEFKVGDLCIYYTLDSFLDPDNPELDFLKDKGKMKPLKSRNMRGVLSQGLLTSLSILKFYGTDPATVKEGDDVTAIMKIKKFVAEEESQSYTAGPKGSSGSMAYPDYLPKTDEEKLQNKPRFLKIIAKCDVVITRKEDGCSATYCYKNGEYKMCSRNFVRVPLPGKLPDDYCKVGEMFKLEEGLKAYGKNIGIQGEIVGPGINKNRLGLKEIDFRVFNVWMIDEKRYAIHEEIVEICEKLHLNTVPVLYKGKFKEEWDSVDKLMKYAESIEYNKGQCAEGIVVKSNGLPTDRRLSFKVVSNAYLLKHNK